MLSCPSKLVYRIMKRQDLNVVARGRKSALSPLLMELKALKKGEVVQIETLSAEEAKLISRRLRSNVSKWKRKGLKGASVHVTDKGQVAIYRD